VLASGSSGNAALLATDKTRILVDAGLSMKELAKRLASIGEHLETLDAILITHEHSDHVSGLPVLARNKKPPRHHLHDAAHRAGHRLGRNRAAPGAFQAGAACGSATSKCRASAFRTTPSIRWASRFEAQGVRIGVATDLGYIPESIKFHLRRTDLLLLEANHDLDMLKVGPYPWSVKQRVMSRVGHLSNLSMSDFLAQDLDSCTNNLVLGHLSEQNNHPAIVRLVRHQALESRGLASAVDRDAAPVGSLSVFEERPLDRPPVFCGLSARQVSASRRREIVLRRLS
jgi:phosphoribosyl 1,2-cyclic phosphodiesterase